MQLGGRRNALFFGVIVSVVFMILQINILHIAEMHTADEIIKFVVSDIMPSAANSLLLTYLAISAGLWPQLVYRLGIVAMVYIPPIIPKYDWYLSGVAWLLLAVATYIVVDRTNRDDRRTSRDVNYRRLRLRYVYHIMYLAVLTGLMFFMVGVFTYKPQAIMSNSMQPVFGRGSIVIVQRADGMQVQTGDIIQYVSAGRSITHRIIKIDQSSDGSGRRIIITKGDNSPSADKPITVEQVVGTVRAQIPLLGYPTVWLREVVQ